MKKIVIGIAGVVVLAVLGFAAVISSYDLSTITVSKKQIDTVLQEKLPIKKKAILYDITIANADLDLSEGNIGILVNIEIDKKGVNCASPNIGLKWKKAQTFLKKAQKACNNMSTKTSKIDVLAVGTIDYRRPKFYFSPASPDDVTIQTEFQDAFLIKHKQVIDAVLKQAIITYLNNLPVFRFKNDAKQTIISMAIESVEVHDDSLQVNISYMTLTKTLIGYVVLVLFSLVLTVFIMRTGFIFPF
ncbi:hypothetical protein LCGC14_1857890 [marine sediment metagenome]|uniref:Uncharacterized protein n=1 Tax=marine sediment metagenome TaxID=412755 RepID=A0A0F9J7F2_9ZZZZ